MAYKNNLITGITELLVLKILEQQDSYVYEIQKMINNNSEHLLSISLNTIYTVTYKSVSYTHLTLPTNSLV